MSRFGNAVGVIKQRRGRRLTKQRALLATPRSATCSCVRVLCVLVLYVRRELGATVPWCIWPGEDPACWGYELRRVVFARAFGNKKKTRHTVYSIAPESLVRCADATAFQEWPPTVSQPPRRAPHFGGTAGCKIHFAINCASFSCPPLMNEAFTAATVDTQLEKLAVQFINDPKRNKITTDRVEISKIFRWFYEDFTKNGDLIDFLNTYSKVKIDKNARVRYMDYNWELNE